MISATESLILNHNHICHTLFPHHHSPFFVATPKGAQAIKKTQQQLCILFGTFNLMKTSFSSHMFTKVELKMLWYHGPLKQI